MSGDQILGYALHMQQSMLRLPHLGACNESDVCTCGHDDIISGLNKYIKEAREASKEDGSYGQSKG